MVLKIQNIPTLAVKPCCGKNKKWLVFLTVLIILVAAVVCLIFFWPKPARTGYQAVFLTNGQVYFGKIIKENRKYVELTGIYYLETQRPLQSQEPLAEGETSQPKMTLIKLGNELHGPADAMQINRDHVIFVEDLKSESKVAQAIEEYKKSQAGK